MSIPGTQCLSLEAEFYCSTTISLFYLSNTLEEGNRTWGNYNSSSIAIWIEPGRVSGENLKQSASFQTSRLLQITQKCFQILTSHCIKWICELLLVRASGSFGKVNVVVLSFAISHDYFSRAKSAPRTWPLVTWSELPHTWRNRSCFASRLFSEQCSVSYICYTFWFSR